MTMTVVERGKGTDGSMRFLEATNLDIRKLITIAKNRENWREQVRVINKDRYRSDGTT